MVYFNSVADLLRALCPQDYQAPGSSNIDSSGLIFNNQVPKKPAVPVTDMSISGLVIEHQEETNPKPEANNNSNTAHHPSKTSKMRATAKDIELLKKHNASLDKNDPNADAQFVEGNTEVVISAAISRVPMEGDTLDSPEFIRITDNTNGHNHRYYYYKLTPELCDGKHFAKFDKNMPIDTSQFKEGQTYYILGLAVDEDSNTRLDLTDHIEIYRLDFSYDADTDTCNYDLIQDEKLQGSGRSSVDYNKCKGN